MSEMQSVGNLIHYRVCPGSDHPASWDDDKKRWKCLVCSQQVEVLMKRAKTKYGYFEGQPIALAHAHQADRLCSCGEGIYTMDYLCERCRRQLEAT